MSAEKLHTQSLGHWLPRDRHIIHQWLHEKVKEAEQHKDDDLNPQLQAFQDYVNGNPTLKKLANDMFAEVPDKEPYKEDPTGTKELQNFEQFILVVNLILQQGPQFFDKPQPATAMGLIGFPINAVLDWPMGTKSGYHFWILPGVNTQFKQVLASWGSFLQSDASKVCLPPPNGWVSEDALNLLAAKGNDGSTKYTFQEMYVCDPSDTQYLGYGSWDQFFTREFRTSPVMIRPVEQPTNDQLLNNSCESAPLQYKTNVKERDLFFLKDQPYSLVDMLNGSSYVSQFVGGSVYQAFLSALSYHRWHSPVNGTIVDVDLVPGTYYSENYFEGFANPNGGPDPSAANNSQPYLSAVATRLIVYIQAEDPIGLMAIVFIGMAEVSSCDATVAAGQTIAKGQELGMFHFGGSSHCMVFRPGLTLTFNEPHPGPPDTESGTWPSTDYNLPIDSALALVSSS